MKGILPFPVGLMWVKGISLKGGGVELRLYQDVLLKLIQSGKAKPSFVFTNKFNIDDAVKAYDDFGNRKLIKAVFQFPSKDHTEADA
jgi:threonine dehydrogenase-like Zn-dependent dehydrogenase